MPDGSSIIFKIPNAALALMLVMAFAAVPGTASAAYLQDGIISAGEYANDFSTGWYNDHHTLQFPQGGGQTTTVQWTDTGSEVRLGLLAPLTVKNMIWGDFVSSATGLSEAILYYQAWCSPSTAGDAAELGGGNCTHHADGFDPANAAGDTDKTFLGKIDSADFKTMVDSEGVKIDGDKFKLIDTKDGAATANGASYVTSLTYIFDNNGGGGLFPNCDSSSCDAVNTAMAFEMLFSDVSGSTNYDIGLGYIAYLQDANNDLVFHMSPERGGPAVIPVPAALPLFISALVGLGFFGRRRKAKLAA